MNFRILLSTEPPGGPLLTHTSLVTVKKSAGAAVQRPPDFIERKKRNNDIYTYNPVVE